MRPGLGADVVQAVIGGCDERSTPRSPIVTRSAVSPPFRSGFDVHDAGLVSLGSPSTLIRRISSSRMNTRRPIRVAATVPRAMCFRNVQWLIPPNILAAAIGSSSADVSGSVFIQFFSILSGPRSFSARLSECDPVAARDYATAPVVFCSLMRSSPSSA
jgi:hypothetical protein